MFPLHTNGVDCSGYILYVLGCGIILMTHFYAGNHLAGDLTLGRE